MPAALLHKPPCHGTAPCPAPRPHLRLAFGLAVCALCALLAAGEGPERTDAWKQAEIASRYARIRSAYPAVPDISVEEAMALQAAGRAVFVDDRTPSERAVSTLPGALGVTEFMAQSPDLQGRQVIVFCTIGERSAARVAELQKLGIASRNLAGSILAWTQAHGHLVDPSGAPSRRVHVFSKSWNLAASGYEPVW